MTFTPTTPLADLGLSARTVRILGAVQVTNLGELAHLSAQELGGVKDVGAKTTKEILDALEQRGLSLRPEL